MFNLTLVLFLLFAHQTLTFDYCTLNCGTDNPHTACGDNCGPASACGGNVKEVEMTAEVRGWFLDRHNEHRNQVALGLAQLGNGFTMQAADMQVLQYDEELEYVAKCWVNQCIFGHDSCRSTERWGWVGQNAYALLSSNVNADLVTKDIIQGSIDAWYNEVSSLTEAAIHSFNADGAWESYAHATQVLWSTTTHLGCAAIQFEDSGRARINIVCNYGPGGNIIGVKVFEQGAPCSNCAGASCNTVYNGLCG